MHSACVYGNSPSPRESPLTHLISSPTFLLSGSFQYHLSIAYKILSILTTLMYRTVHVSEEQEFSERKYGSSNVCSVLIYFLCGDFDPIYHQTVFLWCLRAATVLYCNTTLHTKRSVSNMSDARTMQCRTSIYHTCGVCLQIMYAPTHSIQYIRNHTRVCVLYYPIPRISFSVLRTFLCFQREHRVL